MGVIRAIGPILAVLIFGSAGIVRRTIDGDPTPLALIGIVVLGLSAVAWSGSVRSRDRVRTVQHLTGGVVVTPMNARFEAALARFDPSLEGAWAKERPTLAVTGAGLEWFRGQRPVRVGVTEWPSVQRLDVAELLGELDNTVHALRIDLAAGGSSESLIFAVRRDLRRGVPNPLDGYAIRSVIHEMQQLRSSPAMPPPVQDAPTPPTRRGRRVRMGTADSGRGPGAIPVAFTALALGAVLILAFGSDAPEFREYAGPGFVTVVVLAVGALLVRRWL